MRKAGAFTLIEMIAVIAIVAIIVAVGIPAMSGLTRAQGLQGGVRQISNAAELARQFAITHRMQAELRIQTPNYTAFSVFTNNWQMDKWSNLPIGVVVDPTLSQLSSPSSIFFKPTGNLVSVSDQIIVVRAGIYTNGALVGTSGNMSTVLVSSVLGRVTIQ
jgi:prepilin-type N-terminal cleavage/methylation domain-containing protein